MIWAEVVCLIGPRLPAPAAQLSAGNFSVEDEALLAAARKCACPEAAGGAAAAPQLLIFDARSFIAAEGNKLMVRPGFARYLYGLVLLAVYTATVFPRLTRSSLFTHMT